MESGYFSEWLKSYRNYLRMRNYSPRTLNSYEQVIKHFAYYVWLRRHTDVTKLVQNLLSTGKTLKMPGLILM